MTAPHVETLEDLANNPMRSDFYPGPEQRDALRAAIALMRGQNGLLARIQTHLAVGCIPITGYKSAHNRLAIEIDSALSYQPKDTADEQ